MVNGQDDLVDHNTPTTADLRYSQRLESVTMRYRTLDRRWCDNHHSDYAGNAATFLAAPRPLN
jgi:hypothetical protein